MDTMDGASDIRKEEKELSTSKMKRLESKKKKAKAFLKLAEENDEDGRGRKRKKTNENTSVDESEESSKKQKVENDKGDDTEKCNPQPMADEELRELRRQIKERQKKNMQRPKLFFKSTYVDCNVMVATPEKSEVQQVLPPLFVVDIQHVIMCSVQGNKASYKPRFCSFLRYAHIQATLVIIVNGISAVDFKRHTDFFPYIRETFDMGCQLISPSQYGLTVLEELLAVSVSERQLKIKTIADNPELNKAGIQRALHFEIKADKTVSVPLEVPVPCHGKGIDEDGGSKEPEEDKKKTNHKDVFSRVELLLNPNQMILEGYPMPAHSGQYDGYVFSKDKYAKVKPTSPIISIDCEMVKTPVSDSELVWIAVVDEDHKVLYETYVLPAEKILDYKSEYSGVYKENLVGITTTLSDVQQKIREILPADAILCGQSFNNDLRALKMFHPYVIDTSVIYNLSGLRERKTGLRHLALEFLGERIQVHGGKGGHHPVEDAIATMKLVQYKLRRGIDFGDIILYKPDDTSEDSEVDEKVKKEVGKPEAVETAPGKISGSKKPLKDESQENDSEKQKTEMTPSSSSANELDPADRPTTSDNNNQSNVAKKKIFFKRPGTSITKSFLEITKEEKKSVMFVDLEENVVKYKDDVQQVVSSTSDKESVTAVRENMSKHQITFLQLHKPEKLVSADESKKKKILTGVDKQIKTLVESTADRTLISIIFSGLADDPQFPDAMAFLHISNNET